MAIMQAQSLFAWGRWSALAIYHLPPPAQEGSAGELKKACAGELNKIHQKPSQNLIATSVGHHPLEEEIHAAQEAITPHVDAMTGRTAT